jgi:hypothetical protein
MLWCKEKSLNHIPFDENKTLQKGEKTMLKRLIDTTAKELTSYNKAELLTAISESEGRTLAAETIGTVTPMLVNITNAEFAASLGADLIMLNIFDVNNPIIQGLPQTSPEDTIREVKRLTGRMVAINLEPAVIRNEREESVWNLTTGRQATVENARKAADMGVDMIVLTGNPGVGVDNEAIIQALSRLKEAVGDRVILTAGKMHASGIISEAGEKILTEKDVEAFVDAGADVILLPAPGTVPGITMEYAGKLIRKAHEKGALAMTTIGTSQEGADEATIRQIALMCKMAGADIHHIGDSGYMGMALPENITAYSVAIRGKRHTYRRMAMSLLR